jgi:hypothetical protein
MQVRLRGPLWSGECNAAWRYSTYSAGASKIDIFLLAPRRRLYQ